MLFLSFVFFQRKDTSFWKNGVRKRCLSQLSICDSAELVIPRSISRNLSIPKFTNKQIYLLSNFHHKQDTVLCHVTTKYHKIWCISFCVTLLTKSLFYTHRLFLKLVKSYARYPKTCKSIKAASLFFLRKKYSHFISVEEIELLRPL